MFPSTASVEDQTQAFPASRPTFHLAYLCALCIYLFSGTQPGSSPKCIGWITSTSGLLLPFTQTEASPRSQFVIGVPQHPRLNYPTAWVPIYRDFLLHTFLPASCFTKKSHHQCNTFSWSTGLWRMWDTDDLTYMFVFFKEKLHSRSLTLLC